MSTSLSGGISQSTLSMRILGVLNGLEKLP